MEALAPYLNSDRELVCIVVPRHPERFDEVFEICQIPLLMQLDSLFNKSLWCMDIKLNITNDLTFVKQAVQLHQQWYLENRQVVTIAST
ncbi:hypothetical protein ACT453_43990, partial [Bacillus sp. D-CC]